MTTLLILVAGLILSSVSMVCLVWWKRKHVDVLPPPSEHTKRPGPESVP